MRLRGSADEERVVPVEFKSQPLVGPVGDFEDDGHFAVGRGGASDNAETASRLTRPQLAASAPPVDRRLCAVPLVGTARHRPDIAGEQA